MKKQIIPTDNDDLINIIKQEIALNGNECDLNHIHISRITSISEVFKHSDFNGDISNWNVSNVTNMNSLFSESKFNGEIDKWNVEKVTKMGLIYYSCEGTQPWWAIEDNEKRNETIKKFRLMEKLEGKLNKKSIEIAKKNKI